MKTINEERFINNTINVNNEMPFNTNISDNDLLIYVLAKKNKGFNMCSVCNINYLYDSAEFNNRQYIKQIKESLFNLSDLGYVGLYDLQYNELSIDTIKPSDNFIIYFGEDGLASEKRVVNGEYFPIEYWYFDNVMNASKNVNARCKFIRYSLIVRRLLNYDSEVNYIAHSVVDKFISNRDTVSNYNNILSDLGLIHFNNDYVSKSTGKNSSTYIAFKHDLAGNKVTLSTFNKILSDIAEKDGLVIQSKEEQSNKRKRKAKDKGIDTSTVISDNWDKKCPDFTDNIGFVTMQNFSNDDSKIAEMRKTLLSIEDGTYATWFLYKIRLQGLIQEYNAYDLVNCEDDIVSEMFNDLDLELA